MRKLRNSVTASFRLFRFSVRLGEIGEMNLDGVGFMGNDVIVHLASNDSECLEDGRMM